MSAPQKIRILIADDVPEARDNVQKLLRFASDIQVVGQAGTGREVIELARTLSPDVILMDVTMPELDGITATQQITSQFPGIAVIMISVQVDPESLRRSLQAGARDYLAKPFGLDDLTNAIRGAYQTLQAARAQFVATAALSPTGGAGGEAPGGARAKVISLFSPKGGVGRTTLAANLAVATKLETETRVALVDGNLAFGDLGVVLNLTSGKTIADLAANAGSLDPDSIADVLVTHSSGVKVLLAPTSPQEAETITAEQVRAILSRMLGMFDYIFVDTRASFDETQLLLLDLSDTVLVLLTMEMTAIKAAKQYLEVAELLGYPGDKTCLVLNRVSAHSQISAEDIESHLKGRIKARIPDEPTAVLQSVNEGVPLVVGAPAGRYAQAVDSLAGLVTGAIEQAELEHDQRRGGLGLRRFFRRGGDAPPAKSGLVVGES